MAYQVQSGEILPGVLYKVIGGGSINYQAITYGSGQVFRGINGVKDFTGSAEVNEASEQRGGGLEYLENNIDRPIVFPEIVVLHGMSIEYELTQEEQVVYGQTLMSGLALEFSDYPLFSFAITETRL